MNWLKGLITIIIVGYGINNIIAQNPVYYQLSTDNGLPSNTVYDLHEDQRGFIWIGCDAGLFRYNGVEYIQYTHPDLKAGGMTDICEDGEGRIYAVNFNGQIIYVESDSIRFINTELFGEKSNWHINVTTSGFLCVVGNGLLGTYDITTDKYQNYHDKESNYLNIGKADIIIGSDDLPIAFSKLDIIKVYPDSFVAHKYSYQELPFEFGGRTYVIQDKNKNYIVYQAFQNYKVPQIDYLTSSLDTFIPLKNYDKLVATLAETQLTNIFYHNNEIYFTTFNGIVIYNLSSAEIRVLFEGISVSSLDWDSNQHMWITTLDEGIFIAKPIFSIYEGDLSKKIKHIEYDGDKLWLGNNQKIIEYDISINNSKFYPIKNKDLVSMEYIPSKGKLYFEQNSFLSYVDNGIVTAEKQHACKDLVFLEDGGTLLATSFSLALRYDMIDFKGEFLQPNSVPYKAIEVNQLWNRTLLSVSNNHFWVGGNSGLFLYEHLGDLSTQEVAHILGDYVIMHLAQINKSDTLYALARSGEVFKIEGLGHEELFKIEQEHLIANHIFYQAPYLAITTNLGLYIYDEETEKLEHFTVFDGLISDEIHDVEIVDSTIWLVTSKGLQSMSFPAKKKYPKPLIYLDEIWVNDSTLGRENVYLNINYNDKLQVNLEAVAYASRQSYQYAYRLLPHDTSWTYLNAITPQILQERMPSGAFELECYAVSHEGIWSDEGIVIKGYVTAPYWQQWWFYLLLGSSGTSLMYLYGRNRLNAAQKRQLLELEKQQLELQEKELLNEVRLLQLKTIRSQMNPHFTFNVLNSIQSYIYKNDKRQASKYLTEFSTLMRKVLDLSNQEKILLAEELELLKLYISLEAIQMPDDFEYEIDVAQDVDIHDIELPLLLIQPYVENSIKHGLHHKEGLKKLYLGIKWSGEEELQIIIEDNGIGRTASASLKKYRTKKHKSFATQANEKRLALVNEKEVGVKVIDKVDLQDKALGTRVILTIQVSWDD